MNGGEPDVTEEIGKPSTPDYTQRIGPSYFIGIYLGVNAIRDLYLLIEGPDCVHMKTQFVQGNHDWLSTLTSVSGFHRIANTALHPDDMSESRETVLRNTMTRLANHAAVPALAVTSMPMAFITGADYERLARDVADSSGKPIIHIPGKALSGDWIDGYAETLNALAGQIDLAGGEPTENRVAIVGHLFDRNEGDQTGNIRELTRLCAALDLEVVSTWLSGRDFAHLREIRNAGTIISLPYGRRAAKRVAKRTGARLLELALPFGLPATEAWVIELGEHFDRQERARALIERELAEIIPKLEWVVPYLFQDRRFGYIGDPHLLPGFKSFAETLGAEVSFAILTNRPVHRSDLVPSSELPQGVLQGARTIDTLVYPKSRTFTRFLSTHLCDAVGRGVDLLVTNNAGVGYGDVATLEFGFPTLFRHALSEQPFLGFKGALTFADAMANTLRAQEVQAAQRARDHREPPEDRAQGSGDDRA